MKLARDTKTTLMLAGGAILLLPLLPRLAGSLTRTVARETGGAFVEAGKGLVVGAGEAIGIPATDPVKCWDAMAKGEAGWGDVREVTKAAAYCQAGDFFAYLVTPNYTQKHTPPTGYEGPLQGLRGLQGLDAQAMASLTLAGLMIWAIWKRR
jgi:hypothetical protein